MLQTPHKDHYGRSPRALDLLLKLSRSRAKKEALTRGQPAHSATISGRTLARIKAQLKEYNTTEVTPQLKTDVRTQAEDSIRALASLYAISNATMRDVHPELITNTDQTQYHYNIDVEKLTKVLLFRGDDPSGLAEVKERPSRSRALKVTAKKKGAKQETATVTGKFKQHLPQRIFATISCNSLGATSPVMFSKPIASLGSQQIVKIKFRVCPPILVQDPTTRPSFGYTTQSS